MTSNSLTIWVRMQVLASSPPKQEQAGVFLPNNLPGQANSLGSGSSTAAEEYFSLFAAPAAPPQRSSTPELLQRPAQRSSGFLRDTHTVETHLKCLLPSCCLRVSSTNQEHCQRTFELASN